MSKAKFLKELTELTKKYGIAIEGCGCCSSPYLIKKPKAQLDGKYVITESPDYNVRWLSWANELDVEEYGPLLRARK